METVLVGLTRKKCVVYSDDILVMGNSFEEHLENLTEVLQRLRQAGLRLKSVTLPRRVLDMLTLMMASPPTLRR